MITNIVSPSSRWLFRLLSTSLLKILHLFRHIVCSWWWTFDFIILSNLLRFLIGNNQFSFTCWQIRRIDWSYDFVQFVAAAKITRSDELYLLHSFTKARLFILYFYSKLLDSTVFFFSFTTSKIIKFMIFFNFHHILCFWTGSPSGHVNPIFA